MIELPARDAEGDAAFRWVSEMVDEHYLPGCRDPEEARSAFEFFAKSAFADHRVRFLQTLDAVRRRIDLSGLRLAEMGHKSGLSHWLTSQGFGVDALDGDFRYRINAPDAQYDVLFSFEVLEHIKDQDANCFDDLVLFNYTGVKACIREMHRVLKPGGKLVLTTPNACSLWCVEQALDRKTPWLHPPHVKEYAPAEVIDLCGEEGLTLTAFDTFFAAHYLDPVDRDERLASYFTRTGHSAADRGDDAFFIFAKV